MNFYIVYSTRQDKNKFNRELYPDKHFDYKEGNLAQIMRVSENDNVLARLNIWAGIQYANICPTKKRAEEIAVLWNEGYKKNGTYLFGK